MTWKTQRVRALELRRANLPSPAPCNSSVPQARNGDCAQMPTHSSSLRIRLHTTGRLIVTTRKIRTMLRKSNNCKLMLCLFFTVVILLAILVLVVKLAPLAALG